MTIQPSPSAQVRLIKEVLEAGLCSGCGACLGLCPYLAFSKDRVVILNDCDGQEGRCYSFCPKIPTDLDALQQSLFDPQDLTPELGPVKDFYLTRAADGQVRPRAQHGGTVTALMALALEEGFIDTAILVKGGAGLTSQAVAVNRPEEVVEAAGSKLVVAPVIEKFNQAAQGPAQKIGLVALPCQALALAKMRTKPFSPDDEGIDKLKLVIGLFCGWALAWRPLLELVKAEFGPEELTGLDIPPSKYHCLEVSTSKSKRRISLDQVFPCVRESCQYCQDMTSEFSDISVGSARLPQGWEEARNWNQVLVRTETGQDLMDLARQSGRLEFGDMPQGNLDRLKKAAQAKKDRGLEQLSARTVALETATQTG
ncbi:MAG: Coenzyme F420 hydrogenase/dehydrogenase, beta subunit C-terminal domain [Deltaproteobacteria bacterium]|nr:Coenzyme F420 hydrogenase/dehydrogenase, beta subunit C-terminal domain [Deltaproteobacteria bacterium]